MLGRIDYTNWIESKFIEALMFFFLFVIFYPLFLYYKSKIVKMRIYSTLTLIKCSKEILDSINVDGIPFDDTNILNMGKARLVKDLIENELKLVHFSVYNYFENLLDNDRKTFFEKLKYLWGLSQKEVIIGIATELENLDVVIKLSNAEILGKSLEVSRQEEIRYMKKYRESLNSTTDIKLIIQGSKVQQVLIKYDRLMYPFRSLITKNIISKLNTGVGTDYLIKDIIGEIIITYTIALKTIHHSVNLWNGELVGLSYKNYELDK
jgi:hypothetical protein